MIAAAGPSPKIHWLHIGGGTKNLDWLGCNCMMLRTVEALPRKNIGLSLIILRNPIISFYKRYDESRAAHEESLHVIREWQRAADEAQRMAYGHRLAEYMEKGSGFLPPSRNDRLSRLSMEP
jgi:hypothetical protein